MKYVIKTMDGATIPITEKQRDDILKAEQNGIDRVLVGDAAIRCKTMNIYPVSVLEQKEGRLHDGTKVIKQFGQWVDARNPKLRLDASHYPEIAKDEVMTPEAWKKRQETPNLPPGEEVKQIEESKFDNI